MEGPASIEPPEPSLHGALLESRQRWRDMVLLGADIAFETDRHGRFTMLEPSRVLGHEAASLLGRDASALTIGTDAGPFARNAECRSQRAWLAAADGSARCLSVSAMALRDGAGGFAGLRGMARDVTESAVREAEADAALRCMQALPTLFGTGDGMGIRGLLDRARTALQAAGCALLAGDDAETEFGAGADPSAGIRAAIRPALPARTPLFTVGLRGEPCAFVPLALEGVPRGIATWRGTGAPPWGTAERLLTQTIAGHAALALRLQGAERALDALTQIDPVTGLLNRQGFMAELTRQLERAAISGGGGSLLFADPGSFRLVNARFGSDAGDGALRAIASRIRSLAGPGGLAARIDDGFAVWLPGADRQTAMALATAIATGLPIADTHPAASLSAGVMLVDGGAADADALLSGAEEAQHHARSRGGVACRIWDGAEAHR